ncbi:4176_t:CDS:2, partial [Cetraspora pellucida]
FGVKYRSLTQEAIDEIKLMTKNNNLSLVAQKHLLKAQFPDLNFQNQDLANVIQKVKKTAELADQLDTRLKEEVQWGQFHNYKQAIMTNTISIARQDLFSKTVKVINEHLTEPITNTIKIEILQCLFISTKKIKSIIEKLYKNNQLVYDGFIKNQYDACLIILQALINEIEQEDALEIWKITDIRSEKRHYVYFVVVVNAISFLCSSFHISIIPKRWYKDHYQDDSISESSIFNYKMVIFNDKNILPIRKPAMILTTIIMLKKSIYKKNLYSCVWSLA